MWIYKPVPNADLWMLAMNTSPKGSESVGDEVNKEDNDESNRKMK